MNVGWIQTSFSLVRVVPDCWLETLLKPLKHQDWAHVCAAHGRLSLNSCPLKLSITGGVGAAFQTSQNQADTCPNADLSQEGAGTSFEKASKALLPEHRPSQSTVGSSTLLLTEERARNSLFAICQSKTLSESHLWVCAQLVLPQPLQAERQTWSDDYRENYNRETSKPRRRVLRAPAALRSLFRRAIVSEESSI